MLFEVLHGNHVQDGMMYPKGSLVESDRDLDVLFANKFVCRNRPVDFVDDKTRPVPMSILDAAAGVGNDNAAASKKAENEKTSGRPVIEQVQELSNAQAEQKMDIPTKVKSDVSSEHSKYGKDITKAFPKAVLANLKVYFNGSKYKVVDPESDLSLNKKKLVSTKDVDAFLMARLEG